MCIRDREVRRLNDLHGVTVFLTTQYLEEADALAHRVGIIDQGRIVEEGTPADLKRAIGADVIVVELEDELELAAHTVRALSRVDDVTIGSRGLTISTSNGAALVAEIAIALNGIGVSSVSLTVRTPSLDDVFLRATGQRLLNASS